MVIGAAGAGKSTLARAVGAVFDLPVIHGDAFYYDTSWVQKTPDETQALFDAAALGAAWVIDGNHGASMAARAERADLIIYVEAGRWRRLWRTLRRSVVSYRRTRPDMPAGCRERIDPAFHFDWVWNFDRRSRPKMMWFLDQWETRRRIVRLTTPQDARRFIDDPRGWLARAGAR